jgi:hypothetical protein
MEDLKKTFKTQEAAYETAISTGNVADAKALNLQLADTVSQLLAAATADPTHIDAYRNELVRKLTRIQYDYNGLVANTDSLETLRRIREYETTKFDSSFMLYLFAFGLACVFLIVLLLFKRQPLPTNTISMTSPATMAPFT